MMSNPTSGVVERMSKGDGQEKKRMLIPGGSDRGYAPSVGWLSTTISPSQTFDYKRML